MKAYMIQATRSGAVLDMPNPVPLPGEALIRVCYSGICGSDLHAYEGRHIRRKPPLIPGHESSGVVEAVGSKEHDHLLGARVTILPEQGCGQCCRCRRGWTNLCTEKRLLGTARWPGGFAEYVTAPTEQLFILPAEVPLRTGALAEPLAVAVHALRQASLQPGQNLIIFGMGCIGSLILALARLYGAHHITACDVKPFNLQHASEKLGATLTLNTSEVQADVQLASMTDLPEIDLGIVAASWHELINQSFTIIRPHGFIGLVGQFNRPGVIDIDKARIKEQTLVSSFTYTRGDFQEAVTLLEQDPELFASVITCEIGLSDVDHCLQSMIAGSINVVKAIIHLGNTE